MTQLHLSTLGELRLAGPDGDVLGGRRKELALLVYLARSGPRPVRREELATLLWGERGEARARHSLRQALLTLRKALGSRLEIDAETVRLAEGAIALDLTAAEEDLAAGRLEEAIAWWNGEFLVGCEDVGGENFRSWLETERATIRRRIAGAFERLVADARADGRYSDSAQLAERWAGAFPDDENAHLRWVESLLFGGWIPDARARHAAAAPRFLEELGERASSEWERLREALVRFDGSTMPRPEQGSAALATPHLVGRGPELKALAAALRGVVRQDGGATIVVEGVEGIGKTRLCEEFLRDIDPEIVFVLRATADAARGAEAWTCARELLKSLGTAPGLSGASNEDLAEVATIIPAIRTRFPDLPQATGEDSLLTNALTRVISDLSFEKPVLVYLDDFGMVDTATRDWILALARDIPPAVMLMLAERNDRGDPITGSPGVRTIPNVRRLKLQPLELGETETLLASMLRMQAEGRHALAERLHASSGGNPFYITETIAALVDQDLITLVSGGAWRLAPKFGHRSLPISSAVQHSIAERIAGVSDGGRRILSAAAELYGPAGSANLAKRSGLPPDEVHRAMDQLIVHRLLRPAAVPGGGAEFTNELVRSVVRDLLPPATRRRGGRRHVMAIAAVLALMFISTAAAGLLTDGPLGAAGAWIVDGIGLDNAGRRFAGRSAVTQRLYDEGLAAFNDNDLIAANRLFGAALAEDSTFAMAGYYAWMSRKGLGLRVRGDTALVRAARLAGSAPELERLLVRARWSAVLQDPQRYVLAESLAVRYPDEPDGQVLLGQALVARGDFMAAIPHFLRVLALDSLGLQGEVPQCRACEAYEGMIGAYALADSTTAELKVAREWTRRQPASERSWTRLAAVLLAQNRFEEARAANRMAASLVVGGGEERIFSARSALRAGNWDAADRELELIARTAPPIVRSDALWWSAISLREQGRTREALVAARSYRQLIAASHAADGLTNSGPPYTAVLEAQILLELGETAAA
ncbi:MAG TPA: AAA family ATPase, partial [Longimicrobiaceae bacterium]|nr:AAA family ATPase [Longimicrobiaceae bacterium]